MVAVGVFGVLRRIVAEDRFVADAIDRLAERAAAVGCVRDRFAAAAASIAPDDVERVRLDDIQVVVLIGVRTNRADVHERNADEAIAHRDRKIPERVRETELERDVLARVPVVVDVDLVKAVRIEREEVWSAVRVLQRDVIGEQCHKVGPPGLVAAEHIEVRAVEFRRLRDAGRLAVARGVQGRAACRQQARHRDVCADSSHNYLHSPTTQ